MGRYRISELARRTGVRPTTLRYYEQEGLLPSDRTPSGYRTYDDEAVERLAFIAAAKRLGLPLAEIRELLGVWQDSLCTDVRRELRPLLRARIADADHRLRELRNFNRRLNEALAELEGPERPGRCDPGCGFLRPRATVPLPAPGLGPPAPQEPISCSLGASDHRERLAEWRRLLADVVTHSDLGDGRRLTFPASSAGALTELVIAEQQCCRFLDVTLRFVHELVELEVRAPEAALPLLAEIFALPTDTRPVPEPAGESR